MVQINGKQVVTEIWKEVPEFPGYEVSSIGRARTYWKVRNNSSAGYVPYLSESPVMLDLYTGPTGHVYAVFTNSVGKTNHQLGNWILRTFVRPPEDGEECRHLDDNPNNNVLSNLAWGTRLDNVHDRLRNGRHNLAKLSVDEVKSIKKLLREGVQGKVIAKQFSISAPIVSEIKTGKIWGFVE